MEIINQNNLFTFKHKFKVIQNKSTNKYIRILYFQGDILKFMKHFNTFINGSLINRFTGRARYLQGKCKGIYQDELSGTEKHQGY